MNETDDLRLLATWLTRKANPYGYWIAVFMTFSVLLATTSYWSGLFQADQWMAASRQLVFEKHEFWRLWTTLLIHSNIEHILGNLLLLVPLTYLLSSYYGLFFLPVTSLTLGGVINYFVLKTLPAQTSLVGISGVVYLMGSLWMTLYLLIDRRSSWRQRFAHILFISVVLFAPETFKPEVSYMSHAVGFVLGVLLAFFYYLFNRKKFAAAEVWVPIPQDPA